MKVKVDFRSDTELVATFVVEALLVSISMAVKLCAEASTAKVDERKVAIASVRRDANRIIFYGLSWSIKLIL